MVEQKPKKRPNLTSLVNDEQKRRRESESKSKKEGRRKNG